MIENIDLDTRFNVENAIEKLKSIYNIDILSSIVEGTPQKLMGNYKTMVIKNIRDNQLYRINGPSDIISRLYNAWIIKK